MANFELNYTGDEINSLLAKVKNGEVLSEQELNKLREIDLSLYVKNAELTAKVNAILATKGYLTKHQDISGKQDVLVSGTNIKSINGQSILGSGNMTISGDASETDIYTRYEPVNKKIFEGKKLWVFGDSITAGVGTDADHYFSQLLADSLGCTLTRKGFSGYAFSHGLDDHGSTVLNQLHAISTAPGNCDILLVCFGVNDWTWGRAIEGDRAIGELWDTTKYTICGAVNLFCQHLQTLFADYPETKIYFVTPTPTKNGTKGTNWKSWNQLKTNYNGDTIRDICNAIIRVSASYGYQSLDLHLYFDGDIEDTETMDLYFPDGLHPSADGNIKMAATLEKLLIANPITAFTFNPIVNALDRTVKELIYRNKLDGDAPVDPTYTITYNINGHGVQPSAVNNAKTLPNPLPTLSDTGWNFAGWYTDSELTVLAVAGADINSDVTLYAKWIEIEEGEDPVQASAPSIITQPTGGIYDVGDVDPLTISASSIDGGVLSYQWYKNNSPMEGEVSSSYQPDVFVAGTFEYYCIVINTLNGTSASVKSNVVTVTVNEQPEQPEQTVDIVNLDTLELAHIAFGQGSANTGIVYDQVTHKLTTSAAGFHHISYFTTPLKTGTEIELSCQWGSGNNFSGDSSIKSKGTAANVVELLTQSEIDTPSGVANAYFPTGSTMGIYASGTPNEWMQSIQNNNAGNNLNFKADYFGIEGGGKLKIQMFESGVKVFINDIEFVPQKAPFAGALKNTDYFLAIHMNTGNGGGYGITVDYIGPIRN